MKYGFVKVAAISPEIKVADTEFNSKSIIKKIAEAEKLGVKLAVFPALTICGATCGDLFCQENLLSGSLKALEKIAKCCKDMLVIVGCPIKYHAKLYDAAVAMCRGSIIGIVPRKNIFGKNRQYFTSGNGVFGEITLGEDTVTICSDMIFKCVDKQTFTVGVEFGEEIKIVNSPSNCLSANGANIIANLYAEYATYNSAEKLSRCALAQSEKIVCGYVLANAGQGESTTDGVFSGYNLICENGEMLAESLPFSSGTAVSEIDVNLIDSKRRTSENYITEEEEYFQVPFYTDVKDTVLTRKFERFPFVPKLESEKETVLVMLAEGLKKRLVHTGMKRVIIGVSGGLDSTLALLVAARALKSLKINNDNITAVTMPGFGTSEKTHSNAEILMQELGCSAKEIDITELCRQHFKDIGHDEKNVNSTYENAQARIRTLVLMDMANDQNALVVGTGDMSELALGFTTYNGDHMSMYGVNSGVSKTLVKALVLYESNNYSDKINNALKSVAETVISPELTPITDGEVQDTEKLIGSYEINDFFMFHTLKNNFKPDKIAMLAKYVFGDEYSEGEIKNRLTNFYKRFFAQQFKRSCMPDGVKVCDISLSPRDGLSLPSDACSALWSSESEKK